MAHLVYIISKRCIKPPFTTAWFIHNNPPLLNWLSLILLLSRCFTLSPYFLLFKTLQQKFLIACNLPSSFLPSLSFLCLLSLSLCLSLCLFLDLYYMSLFRPASGLISSAAMQLDRDSFPVPFCSLLTSLFILTLS